MKRNSKKSSQSKVALQSKRRSSRVKALSQEQRSKATYELYNLCAKNPEDWYGVPEMALPAHLMAFAKTLRQVHVPDDCSPQSDVPKAAKSLERFIAVHKGAKYYIDKGNNSYFRYALRIFDERGLLRFTIKKGEVFWSPEHGEVVVDSIHLCTFPTDNDKEGVVYYCKPIVKK